MTLTNCLVSDEAAEDVPFLVNPDWSGSSSAVRELNDRPKAIEFKMSAKTVDSVVPEDDAGDDERDRDRCQWRQFLAKAASPQQEDKCDDSEKRNDRNDNEEGGVVQGSPIGTVVRCRSLVDGRTLTVLPIRDIDQCQ